VTTPGVAAAAQQLTAAEEREAFAENKADDLATHVGAAVTARVPETATRLSRFVRYSEPDVLTLVVGEQEEGDVDTALAIGLGERGDRALRLVLPTGWHEPTLHRWAWLRDDLPLACWRHDGTAATREHRPSRRHTQDLVVGDEDPQLHLGDRTEWVAQLMRWAGEQSDLDASHRRDVRAWQCRGQRVLRISRTRDGLNVIGGIAWSPTSGHTKAEEVEVNGPLTSKEENTIRVAVLAGMV
jgi:hypothetical protein